MRFSFFLFWLFSFSTFSQDYLVEDHAKYTFEMIEEDLLAFSKVFPELTKLDTFARSEFDLPMYRLVISKNGINGKWPLVLVGNIHAREDYSSKYVMKFANLFLLSASGKSAVYPDAASLLEKWYLVIIPVANPDGLKIAHEDWTSIESHKDSVLALKRMQTLAEWKANGKGIDLNSNFNDGNHLYKCSAINQEAPASEGYKGCFPSEAKEVIALEQLLLNLNPLLTLSFHTKGNVLFWRDCDTYTQFNEVDSIINHRVARQTGLNLAPISYNPISYGCGLENFVRARLSQLAVCVELSPMINGRIQHPDRKFNELVWKNCEQLPIIYMQAMLDCQEQWTELMKNAGNP